MMPAFLPTAFKSASLQNMRKPGREKKLHVCILSPHPMVLEEFQRVLCREGFLVQGRQLESTLAPDLRKLPVPRASVFVVDAHTAPQASVALISNILDRYPTARLLVVDQNFKETDSYALLRMGVKGLLTYSEAREQLARALPLVEAGGFWVPRPLLSRFVDSILNGLHGRRLKTDPATELSRREQEVLEGLLENLANKEVASKLNISERTVKFHVSNLLAKFGVRRRADLILLCYQRRGENS